MTVLSNAQIATAPSAYDFPFLNLSGADIAAFIPVQVDTTAGNQMAAATNGGIPIVPVAGVGNVCVGVTMEIIKNGASGPVRCPGPICLGVADGVIAANAIVDASNTANRTIKSHGATLAQIGIALSAAVDADTIPFLMCIATNK